MVKPVQVGVSTISVDNSSMLDDFSEWSIDAGEFLKGSGRSDRYQFEVKQRLNNPSYAKALFDLSQTFRCAHEAEFAKYAGARLANIQALKEELFTAQRRNVDWRSSRRLQSYLSRICDRMFDRTSLKVKRSFTTDTEELRKARTNAKHQKKCRKEDPPSVVFFGDGTFKPGGFGYASVPKKNILKLLCNRGCTVLLDEHRTSRACPCGKADLDTYKNNKGPPMCVPVVETTERTSCRIRCHKTFLTGDASATSLQCDVLNMLEEQGIPSDRDVIAVMNMLQCGHNAIRGKPRPVHLCRIRPRE